MDNLLKAMHCFVTDCQGEQVCEYCPYDQAEYGVCGDALFNKAIETIVDLRKSNRNWRRKVQRLRKEIKELKEASKV